MRLHNNYFFKNAINFLFIYSNEFKRDMIYL
jgi:hypothetical protein